MNDTNRQLTRIVDGRVVPAVGTWDLDGGHTHSGFAVRHLLTLMRGRFREQSGIIVIAEDPLDSTVEVTLQAASIDTTMSAADDTVRGEGFLDVENHPTIEFRSRSVVPDETGRWKIVGDLTVKGITHEVSLDTEFLGAVTHPMNSEAKMSFSASTTITRSQYDMAGDYEAPDGKGVLVVGNRIDLQLDVEANLRE